MTRPRNLSPKLLTQTQLHQRLHMFMEKKGDYPNLLRTARLREDLVELLERPVDVIRYRERMNPTFKARLEQEAVYV